MLRPTYPIVTGRLSLRPVTVADLDDVWAFQGHPAAVRYLTYEPRSRAQSRASVEQMAREDRLTDEGDCLSLAVVPRDSGHVVGQVELVWRSREHRQGEIGYVFHPDHQGRGLATEAAVELLRLGFEALDLHRIAGRCMARNTASARLLERLGMRREAHLVHTVRRKGAWQDELVYAMLQDEWRNLARSL